MKQTPNIEDMAHNNVVDNEKNKKKVRHGSYNYRRLTTVVEVLSILYSYILLDVYGIKKPEKKKSYSIIY